MYRSEPQDPALVAAAAHAARALTKLGAGDVVKSALADPYTSDAVRAKLDPEPAPSTGGGGTTSKRAPR